jgi:precorrin-6Y C5,15-methyltransferase (decarboxylating)
LNQTKTLHLIGISSPKDLTEEQKNILKEAEVLAAPARLLSFFPDFPGLKLPLTGSLADWLERIAQIYPGAKTVVLASGDPNFFGLAKKLLTRVEPESVVILPGLTTVQKAFALWRKSWADTETVSLHGRDSWRIFWSAVFRLAQWGELLCVFTDPDNTPAKIAKALLTKGLTNFAVHVFEELGTQEEKISHLSLDEAAGRCFSPLNLLVLEVTQRPAPVTLGGQEEIYEPENGLITKKEIRSVALGLMELTGQETFWDLGAGTGSVSIEAGRLLEYGELWAIEKNPQRVLTIAKNLSKFGLAHLNIIQGRAPGALKLLPDPDRVYVGGGGDDLPAVLEETYRRLRPGGLIVAAAVDPVRLTQAVQVLSRSSPARTVQLSVARSQELAHGYYFKPLTPLWLIKGQKPLAR